MSVVGYQLYFVDLIVYCFGGSNSRNLNSPLTILNCQPDSFQVSTENKQFNKYHQNNYKDEK
jgi:hypothetical protein